jgi:hypothetical protein
MLRHLLQLLENFYLWTEARGTDSEINLLIGAEEKTNTVPTQCQGHISFQMESLFQPILSVVLQQIYPEKAIKS